ncbi:MAG: TldD/PmbA family protein [Candidatus Aminicenantes bacterium]|nr:MAG: TldD/PmbA family protein [Candidatus Aminicenantes bacterium]
MALAESLVSFGRSQGTDEIEVSILDGLEFSVDVRLGKIESLVEAGSRYLGLKIIKDNKTAYATSSDLNTDTLKQLVKNAIWRAELANPDEFAGLPMPKPDAIDIPELNIYDHVISELTPDKKIALALETEKIALSDRRISNSHGASFETKEIHSVLANSHGFIHDYKETFCSLSVGIQAGETDSKVEDYWSSTERHFRTLDPPEKVAKKAVERTIRQLNPRKVKTQVVPVIFEPTMTNWLLGFLFACVSGTAVYQKLSFLSDKLGKKIGNEYITVYDDGRIPGKLGTRPYDSEGVPTRKNKVIEKGTLKNFLCNTYAGKKLNLPSTGNADGAGVGPNNFYLHPGDISPEDIIQKTEKGLILLRTIGHGLNPVTGDISRGAFGLWIENGEIAYPVSEITIAGNLGMILNQIEEKGNDLEFRSAICGPTIKIHELTVAGE